jgi:hypothetical protein
MQDAATTQQVMAFFSTPERPVTVTEMRALSTEDRVELKHLVGATL